MSNVEKKIESIAQFEALIERCQARDTDARDELLHFIGERLRKVTAKMMQKYERLQRWVDVDDVVQNATVRLLRAMEAVPVRSAGDFFALAALQIRRELVDLCRHYFGQEGAAEHHDSVNVDGGGADDKRPLLEPSMEQESRSDLLHWTEFHGLIETLPEKERCVVELIWYHGMTQAQAAEVLRLSEAKVKRLWVTARDKIKNALGSLKA